MIDIKGDSTNPRSARPSNFTPRPFVFDGVQCSGFEGILQSLKCSDLGTQKTICRLQSLQAKQWGRVYNSWKDRQFLWWNGVSYNRSSREYFLLITRIYDAVYDQDESFKNDLLAVGYEDLYCSTGNPDMRDTVLTEVEMIYQLNRLRIRALKGSQ